MIKNIALYCCLFLLADYDNDLGKDDCNGNGDNYHLLPHSSRPPAAGSMVVVPAGQLVQSVFIRPEAYVPLGQGKHLASPLDEKYPGLHFSVTTSDKPRTFGISLDTE